MGKFTSEFTSSTPSGFYSKQGVVEKAADYSNVFNGLSNMVSSFSQNLAASKDAEAKALADAEKRKDKESLGAYALQQLDLESSQAERNQQIANLRSAQQTLALSDDPADQQRLASVQREYAKLIAAEEAGANPASIKARQRALLKKQIAENPHLASEILTTFGKVDTIQQADAEMSADPRKEAINQMIAQSTKGIPVSLQIDVARTKQEAELLKLQAEVAAEEGKMTYTEELVLASTNSALHVTDVAETIESLVNDSISVDENGVTVNTFNAKQAETVIRARIQSNVEEYRTGILTRYNQANQSITKEQLDHLVEIYEGNIVAAYKPYLESLDQKEAVTRLKDIQAANVEIAKNTNIQLLSKYFPELALIKDNFGGDSAYKVGAATSRVQKILADDLRGGPAVLSRLAQNDPDLAMAMQIINGQGLAKFVHKRMESPKESTGNPAVDTAADRGGIEETKDGTLNQLGQSTVLTNVLYGSSFNNVNELMSDGYYNQVQANPEYQNGVRNVLKTDAVGMFDSYEAMDELMRSGVSIAYDESVLPRRVRDGRRWKPAPAFSASEGASVDTLKQVNKLNAAYTLLGSFDPEGAVKFAKERVKYTDTSSPEFIKRHSEGNIRIFEEKRQQSIDLYQPRVDGRNPNIYDTSPDRHKKYRAQQRFLQRRETEAWDQLILNEKLRNEDYASSYFTHQTQELMDRGYTLVDTTATHSIYENDEGRKIAVPKEEE